MSSNTPAVLQRNVLYGGGWMPLHPGTKDYNHSGELRTYSRIHGVGTATMSTAGRH